VALLSGVGRSVLALTSLLAGQALALFVLSGETSEQDRPDTTA
jgi:hypothetical protein